MDIDRYIQLVANFFADKPILTVIVLLALILFCIKKTKEAIKVAVFLLFLAAGFYVFSMLGDASFSGYKSKTSGTIKSQGVLDE